MTILNNMILFLKLGLVRTSFQSLENNKDVKMCLILFGTLWIVAHQAPLSMEFPRQEYWSGLPFPSLGIFTTQGLNPWLLHLLHCRQIFFYPLSHQGSPIWKDTHCSYTVSVHTVSWLARRCPLFLLAVGLILCQLFRARASYQKRLKPHGRPMGTAPISVLEAKPLSCDTLGLCWTNPTRQ